MPAVIPVTIPLIASTEPIGGALLLHVPVPPDAVASVNVMVKPVHTEVGPLIAPAAGDTLTVITCVTLPHAVV